MSTELGGRTIAEGDKVVVWYTSANRDESVFDEPYRLDLRRRPNPHTTFGRAGPHRCLGEHLARLEVRVVLQEMLPRPAAAGIRWRCVACPVEFRQRAEAASSACGVRVAKTDPDQNEARSGNLLFIQHSPNDTPGALGFHAAHLGYGVMTARADLGLVDLDQPNKVSGLVVMGSLESVTDPNLSWLKAERRYVDRAIESGVPVLGVCFGAQLLAEALGGQVRRAPQPEVGWLEVETTQPDRIPRDHGSSGTRTRSHHPYRPQWSLTLILLSTPLWRDTTLESNFARK